MLLWLQGEGVHVDAWVGSAGVVHIWLVLVEVLAELLLETVLAVEDQLEVAQRANLAADGDRALLDPEGVRAGPIHGGIGEQVGAARHVGQHGGGAGGGDRQELQGVDGHVHVADAGGEVPHAVDGGGGGVLVSPDQLLHWVVEGQADGVLCGGQGVATGVLHLLDQVLMALLGEAAALLGVEVHVVGPHLEDGAGRAEVVAEVAGQVEVKADLVVLQGNQGQVQAWVAVEEEQKGQVHVRLVGGRITDGGRRRGQLAVVDLLSLRQEHLGVQAEPGLVVLVDALATDGQLNGGDGALRHPAHVDGVVLGGQVGCGAGLGRQQSDVHVADQIAVAGDGHGHAAGVGCGAVHRLLNVLHSEVGVALVHGLEEGHLGLTGQIHVLCAISNELHKSTGHFVLYPKKKI